MSASAGTTSLKAGCRIRSSKVSPSGMLGEIMRINFIRPKSKVKKSKSLTPEIVLVAI